MHKHWWIKKKIRIALITLDRVNSFKYKLEMQKKKKKSCTKIETKCFGSGPDFWSVR